MTEGHGEVIKSAKKVMAAQVLLPVQFCCVLQANLPPIVKA